jgi:hypothetical protein
MRGPAVLEAKRKLNLYHQQERAAGRQGFGQNWRPLVENDLVDGRTPPALGMFQEQRKLKHRDHKIWQETLDALDQATTGAATAQEVGPPSPQAPPTPVPELAIAPPTDADRSLQVECVNRLGGCTQIRDGGTPSVEEIAGYNASCRAETRYAGPDVTPTSEECSHLPLVPLSTAEKILIGAFLYAAALAAAVVIVVVGAEIGPVIISSVTQAATAGWVFYLANAIVVNEIGLFAIGLLFSCAGNVSGLLRAIADDPTQGAALLAEVYVVHVNIQVGRQPARPATVPAKLLPPEEQTAPGQIKFKTAGLPLFEETSETGPQPAGAPARGVPPIQPGTWTPPGRIEPTLMNSTWLPELESSGPEAAAFESQVRGGRKESLRVWTGEKTPSGAPESIEYDDYRQEGRSLVDAKARTGQGGSIYDVRRGKFAKDVIVRPKVHRQERGRQISGAREVVWVVQDKEIAAALRAFFSDEGFTTFRVEEP